MERKNCRTVEEVRIAYGLPKTSAGIRKAKRILHKLQNPEDFRVAPDRATMQSVVAEYNCDCFVFVLKAPRERHANIAIVSKEVFLRHCDKWLVPSTVTRGGEQKRDEAGKPCFRFRAEAMRRDLVGLLSPKKLDLEGRKWQSWIAYAQSRALRNNAGCYAETRVCALFGWRQIGELDRQNHMIHCDAVDAEGKTYEIKLETGYLTSQFWTPQHDWDTPPEDNN